MRTILYYTLKRRYDHLTRTVVLINLSRFLLDLRHLPGSFINLAPGFAQLPFTTFLYLD